MYSIRTSFFHFAVSLVGCPDDDDAVPGAAAGEEVEPATVGGAGRGILVVDGGDEDRGWNGWIWNLYGLLDMNTFDKSSDKLTRNLPIWNSEF